MPGQGTPPPYNTSQAMPMGAQPPPMAGAPTNMTPGLAISTGGLGARLLANMGNTQYGGAT